MFKCNTTTPVLYHLASESSSQPTTTSHGAKSRASKKLATADRVALTTDCWAALTAESYLTITSHHISDDWQMSSAVLLTQSLPGRHTAHLLTQKMNEPIEQRGFEGRVIACVLVVVNFPNDQ